MTENRIFCVTLAFNPPGPLTTSMLIAPDETMAAAMAMQSAMAVVPPHTTLLGTAVFAVDPDVLRQMLRAVDGRETGQVVSLVPKQALEPDDPRRGPLAVDPALVPKTEAAPTHFERYQALKREFSQDQRAAGFVNKHEGYDSCHCPAGPGLPCTLAADQCQARRERFGLDAGDAAHKHEGYGRCDCPAGPGKSCTLTIKECLARSAANVGRDAGQWHGDVLNRRAAEILRQHPESAAVPDLSWAREPGTLDAADASTFTGLAAETLWEDRRRMREENAVCVYGEQFGPPAPALTLEERLRRQGYVFGPPVPEPAA